MAYGHSATGAVPGSQSNNPYSYDEQMQQLLLQQTELTNKQKAFEQQQAQVKAMAEQGLNPDGSPIAPEYRGITDANGNLDPKYQLAQWQSVMPDTAAMDMYKQTALRDAGTQSPWAKLMLDKQAIDQANAVDSAGAGAANSFLQATSNLAKTGGVSGGARERLASKAANAAMIGQNQVARQGQLDKYNILTQDETNRMSGLQTLQGMQNNAADAQFKNAQMQQDVNKFNTGNLLSEVDKQRLWEQDQWKQKMQTWGANKSADAQAKAANSSGGGGGCFITTVVCDGFGLPDNNDFLNTFRKFRDTYMGGRSAADVKKYYEVAPTIAEQIKGDKRTIKRILHKYLVPAYFKILSGNNEGAYRIYKSMVLNLQGVK